MSLTGAGTASADSADAAAASAISDSAPAKCQARTRLYRDGKLELEGFPVAEIGHHMADESVTVWLDLRGPDHADLAVLSQEFGLHPLAVEDAGHERQRPKLDRYRSHLFLTAYGRGWTPRPASWPPVSWPPSSPARR